MSGIFDLRFTTEPHSFVEYTIANHDNVALHVRKMQVDQFNLDE